MERKIGEIFEYNSEWYQCVGGTCRNCSFYYDTVCKNITTIGSTNFGNCHCSSRTDHKSVIFKKLEKVGEPFTIVGKLYQHYKVFDIYNVCGDGFWCVHNYKAKTLTIEIKQNKEDMEAKNNNYYDGRMDEECIPLCDVLNSLPGVETTSSCCGHCKNDFMIFFNCNNSYSLAVIARAFNRRYSGTFLEWKIEVETHDNGRYDFFMHSVKPYPNMSEMRTDVGQLIENLETWKAEEYKEYFNYEGEEKHLFNGMPQEAKEENKQKPGIKPFDLEAAKAGKPVCTKSGKKVRIVCFDKVGAYPVIALVQEESIETCHFYSQDGKSADCGDGYDLIMLCEKRKGYINVYSSIIHDTLENADNVRKRINKSDYLYTLEVEWEE